MFIISSEYYAIFAFRYNLVVIKNEKNYYKYAQKVS